jgi:hypothetical protein
MGRVVNGEIITHYGVYAYHMKKKQRKDFQMNWRALFYMVLLAVQFGVQPILTRRYTSPVIIKSTVILTQEVVKFVIAWILLTLSGASSESFKGAFNSFLFICYFVLPHILTLCLLLCLQCLRMVCHRVAFSGSCPSRPLFNTKYGGFDSLSKFRCTDF